MKKAGNLKLLNKILIAVLSVIMLGATAATFAFWANEIKTTGDEENLTVLIGKGNAVNATISTSNMPVFGANKSLIPKTLGVGDWSESDETKAYIFEIPVVWTPVLDKEITVTGDLEVVLTGVNIGGDSSLPFAEGLTGGETILQLTAGLSTARLTDLDDTNFLSSLSERERLTESGYGITKKITTYLPLSGNPDPAVYLYIMVQIDEPANQVQYESIAKKVINMNFSFNIVGDVHIGDQIL